MHKAVFGFLMFGLCLMSACTKDSNTSCATPGGSTTTGTTTTTAVFKWNSADGAVAYKVQYQPTDSTNWTTTTTNTDSLVVGGLKPSTLYQWEVQTLCSGGISSPTYPTGFTTATPGSWAFKNNSYIAPVANVTGHVLSATSSAPAGTLAVYFPGSSLPLSGGNYGIVAYNGTPGANTLSIVLSAGANTYYSTGTGGTAIVSISGGKVSVSMVHVEMQNTAIPSDTAQMQLGVLTQP